jgi:hypothetical protein
MSRDAMLWTAGGLVVLALALAALIGWMDAAATADDAAEEQGRRAQGPMNPPADPNDMDEWHSI